MHLAGGNVDHELHKVNALINFLKFAFAPETAAPDTIGRLKNEGALLEIAVEPLASNDASALIEALNTETLGRYPDPADNFFELAEEEVAPGRGAFLVARWSGRAVGCGAVRMLEATTAELKRMYVAPDARGRGIGGAIVAALEEQARRLGARRLVLETGDRQPEAIALYTRAGFTPIPCFGEYANAPRSRCFGKVLVV
jgi:GNAT superfamily N-acetyltransferase